MLMAIESSGLTAADIGHVNAHATSTPVGDIIELRAIRNALGDHPIVTATKSMTGHLLGAAGAVESIAAVLAIRDGVVPVTLNLDDPDDGVELDVVRVEPRRANDHRGPQRLVRVRRSQRLARLPRAVTT